jgi:hypothetical protein
VGGEMLKLRDEIKIYVGMEPIDARKSIDSLCAIIVEYFNDNPQCGSRYILKYEMPSIYPADFGDPLVSKGRVHDLPLPS